MKGQTRLPVSQVSGKGHRHLWGSGVEIFHGGQGENLNIGFDWTLGSGYCVCVCVCVCMCVCVYKCMHVCVELCECTYIVYMYVCASVSVCTCMLIDHKCNHRQDLYIKLLPGL